MSQLTIQQAFELAVKHHQAGQLQQAEHIYRQILAQQPNQPDALHLLGLIAHQVGRNDMAVDLIRQALALRPNFPGAYSNLGLALKAQGQLDEAIAAYRQAITLKPQNLEAYSNLGVALKERGQLDQAIAVYRQALAFNPHNAQTHNNLGNALKHQGKLEEAVSAYKQALALNPNYPEAHLNLGIALRDKGQLEASIAACRQALAFNPNFPEAHYHLGLGLKIQGQLDAAIAAFRKALALNPNNPDVLGNLGTALKEKGQFDEAAAAYRQAIALNPSNSVMFNNLGVVLGDRGQIDEAAAAYRQAVALNPRNSEAVNNLGIVLGDMGKIDEAAAVIRQALALAPDNAMIHSNLVFTLLYHPAYDAPALAQENRRWNLRHAAPLRPSIQPHPNDRNPGRRLKIGYVSPDFREHAVGRNMMPLFQHLDHEHFETFCYANVAEPDQLTEEFRRRSGTFRMVCALSDQALADQIRADGIDILVDLALHSAWNRLLVFARQPAPVQVTFAGYPGSTGLDSIDYRLTDPYLDPPESGADELYAEKSIRLPATFWCYDPLENAGVIAGPLPALANGYVTFGCLHNFCKVNEGILKLWAQALAGVPGSRLVLLADEGAHRQRTRNVLEGLGVSHQRVTFFGKRPRLEYLQLYQQIDIGLDTVPYNGHTTSLDSYFMGVPVVTLVGRTVVGRAGLSQLMNLGMPELIARTDGEYLHIARDLATDLGRLAGIRAALRGRMQTSPLMDGAAFARGIEAAYRQMWRQWCATL